MEAYTKVFQTPQGPVEGIQTRWPGFSILMVTGTLDRFPNRKVVKVNEKAKALGIRAGMEAGDAFALIA